MSAIIIILLIKNQHINYSGIQKVFSGLSIASKFFYSCKLIGNLNISVCLNLYFYG